MATTLVQEDAMLMRDDAGSNTSHASTVDALHMETTSPTFASGQPYHDPVPATTANSSNSAQIPHLVALDLEAIESLRALSQSNESNSSRSSVHTSSPTKTSIGIHAGYKRTATGEVKGRFPEETSSPKPGHSRQTSTLSNGSTVTELSQQLRTRLSYAMVKVQNGWQSNSIDEVENLASQHGSPVATTANGSGAPLWQSPRTEMTEKLRRQWSDSGSSEGGGTFKNGKGIASQSHAALQRSLAPPADINGAQVRRRRPAKGTGADGLDLTIPSTPPRRQPRSAMKQRTPSQNAAMEADAIETLLFMSSPGNSSYHPNPATPMSQTSPLRSQFRPSEVAPKAGVSHRQPVLNGRSGIAVDGSDDIDRILDEMDSDDESIGSEEAAFLRQSGLGALTTVQT